MERRLTIGSLTALSLSPIWARIGVAIVVTSYLLVARMPADAPSVRSHATPTVRTLFPTSAACPWRPPINCFVTGVTSTELVGVEPPPQDRSRRFIPHRFRPHHFRQLMFPSLRVWSGYILQEQRTYHLRHHPWNPTVVARLLRMGLIIGIINSLRRVFRLDRLLEQESLFPLLTPTSHCSLRQLRPRRDMNRKTTVSPRSR